MNAPPLGLVLEDLACTWLPFLGAKAAPYLRFARKYRGAWTGLGRCCGVAGGLKEELLLGADRFSPIPSSLPRPRARTMQGLTVEAAQA